MNDELDRATKLKLIYRHTHKDYKGTLPDGTQTVLVCRGGTCLVALNDLTDAEIADKIGYAVKKERERLDAIEAKKPIRTLTCCCCGNATRGRQWWNRDTGYGLGKCCIDYCSRGETDDSMRSLYGVRGIHYDVTE